jgi:hypothetical protein
MRPGFITWLSFVICELSSPISESTEGRSEQEKKRKKITKMY